MLASAHETVSKAIIKGGQKIKILQHCRTGHTITEQFRPSESNEKVQHKKSSRGTKKETKKSILFQKPDFTCCQGEEGEPHIFLSGSSMSLNIQEIHFQLHCWRDSTIKGIRRMLAVQSERISDEGKTRSKYCDRLMLGFCRHRLGFAYLRRQLIPWKKKKKKK